MPADEIGRVAFIYSAWRPWFAPEDKARLYVEQTLGKRVEKPLQIWNADVAAHRHAITERFSGCPVWYPRVCQMVVRRFDQFPIGQWPLKLISFKIKIPCPAQQPSSRAYTM